MKIKTAKNIKEFFAVADACIGDVWLEFPWGEKYSLKSELCQYLAAYDMIHDKGEYLELFCQFREDEEKFYKYFEEHPEVL